MDFLFRLYVGFFLSLILMVLQPVHAGTITEHFEILPNAEVAVEVDPRAVEMISQIVLEVLQALLQGLDAAIDDDFAIAK